MRAILGMEYTYLDFRINNGKARVTATSLGEETKENFYRQELPIPTLGLAVSWGLSPHVAMEVLSKGNWIQHWDSLRHEGGRVYLSQYSVETTGRLVYRDPARLGTFHAFMGVEYRVFHQDEESREDGNVVHVSTISPMVGVGGRF